jgi:hypothetical protein
MRIKRARQAARQDTRSAELCCDLLQSSTGRFRDAIFHCSHHVTSPASSVAQYMTGDAFCFRSPA